MTCTCIHLSGEAQAEIQRLLLLLLGCAIQCEKKEMFIDNIKRLPINTQHAIVDFIKDVRYIIVIEIGHALCMWYISLRYLYNSPLICLSIAVRSLQAAVLARSSWDSGIYLKLFVSIVFPFSHEFTSQFTLPNFL